MPGLIRLVARVDFSMRGETRKRGEVFDVAPILAVMLRARNVVDFAPLAPKVVPVKPRRMYRRRDLVPEP